MMMYKTKITSMARTITRTRKIHRVLLRQKQHLVRRRSFEGTEAPSIAAAVFGGGCVSAISQARGRGSFNKQKYW